MEQQQDYMMEINMYQCCKYKLDLPVITLPFIFVMSINSSHDVVSDRAGTISWENSKIYLKTIDP